MERPRGLSEARKYRAGITITNQNLGQFPRDLLNSVLASTAIKLASGMSAKDASTLAKEMRCEPELLRGMRKREHHTEFACYVRNVTEQRVRLAVPFGTMQSQTKLTAAAYERLLELNRAKHCGGGEIDTAPPPKTAGKGFELGEWGEL